jgi:hypothetical protein
MRTKRGLTNVARFSGTVEAADAAAWRNSELVQAAGCCAGHGDHMKN